MGRQARRRLVCFVAVALLLSLLTQRSAFIGGDGGDRSGTAPPHGVSPERQQSPPHSLGGPAWGSPPPPGSPGPQTQAVCRYPPRSFEPLGEFQFWGRAMNTSWACPTNGMNNQLTLLHAMLHCAAARGLPSFEWKDISCSPTGGRDGRGGRGGYAVGSDDYEYAWFRWSEVFTVHDDAAGGHPHRTAICLADELSWSGQRSQLRHCPSNIGHLIDTPQYWESRRRLRRRPPDAALGRCFLRFVRRAAAAGGGGFEAAVRDGAAVLESWANCSDATPEGGGAAAAAAEEEEGWQPVLGVHVRRGDYGGFCRGMMHGSGARKFRVPAFKWLRARNATRLSDGRGAAAVLAACAPSDASVAAHIDGLARRYRRGTSHGADGPGSGRPAVVVATTQAALLAKLRAEVSAADVSSTAEWLRAAATATAAAAAPRGALGLRWPRQLSYGAPAAAVTATDRAVLDIVVLSLVDVPVLNRYSTFSQSSIDLRVLHGAPIRDLHWW